MAPKQIPPLSRLLARPRVTETLAEAARAFPLTVLAAPMGYGKTLAARSLLGLHDRVFYIRVNPGPHNALYLWDMAFGQLEAQGSRAAPTLRRMGFPADVAQLHRTLEFGRRYLEPRPTILMVDDYHFVTDPRLDALVEAMARERMPGYNILLISRGRPNLPLEDLKVKGLAAVFDQELLAFSPGETDAYFRLHGVDDPRAAGEARGFSEGWPAALWLSLASFLAGGPADPRRDLDELMAGIFAAYTPADQKLLTCLSLLNSFTPAQAALLSGDRDAPARLRGLFGQNALLSRDEAGGYQLHSLFRAFLADRLTEGPAGELTAWYRRAGEIAAREGRLVDAAGFFTKAGRDEDLLRLLELFTLPGANLALFFSGAELAPLVLAVPWRLRLERPLEYLTFIYFYLAEVSVGGAWPLLEEAEHRFEAAAGFPPALRRRLLGETTLMRGLLAFNDLWAMRDIHEEAHKLLSGRSQISSRHMVWTFGCPQAAFLYLRKCGQYREMVELVEGHLHYFQDLSNGCSTGAQLLFRAEFSLERGETAEVESMLTACLGLAESREQLATSLAAVFGLARLYLADGRPGQALALLADWRPKVDAAGHVDHANCFDLIQGYIRAILGQVADIPGWLLEDELAPSRDVPQIAAFVRVVMARALLARGDYGRLEAAARALPAYVAPFDNLLGRIQAQALEAISTFQSRGRKALESLRAALALARPDGILLVLAEYGAHLRPLLAALRAEDADHDPYLERLSALTETFSRIGNGAVPKGAARGGLTAREKEVLRLAAEGQGNGRIAELLGISPVTVKKLLSSAYARLQAKNRAEAVRKFLERG